MIKRWVVVKGLLYLDDVSFQEWLETHTVDGFYHIVGDDPYSDGVIIEVMSPDAD